jgi:hypothetical protein
VVGVFGLPDIDVLCSKRDQTIDHLGLMFDRFAHEIEMDAVLADLRFRDGQEVETELAS